MLFEYKRSNRSNDLQLRGRRDVRIISDLFVVIFVLLVGVNDFAHQLMPNYIVLV